MRSLFKMMNIPPQTAIHQAQNSHPATVFLLFSLIFGLTEGNLQAQNIEGEPWKKHVIDDSSQGADGVRILDVNGDKLPDIATGWEEGGEIHACLHPGKNAVTRHWPRVIVGKVASPEDAVFADLDQDGSVDVVSCCEGKTKAIFVHWAPEKKNQYQSSSAWQTDSVPAAFETQRWMYSLPMQVDGKNGLDLVAGGKNQGASIGWFEIPATARNLQQWNWHPLCQVGWLMSLHQLDIDQDGDQDIVFSDRRGPFRGCRWLENPGPKLTKTVPWKSHLIGGADAEVMFMELADLNSDGLTDFVAATKDQGILCLLRNSATELSWSDTFLPMPPNTGTAKAAQVADLDGRGNLELIISCENAENKHGLFGLHFKMNQSGEPKVTGAFSISSFKSGIKYDRMEILDLDLDGDQDILTCEERDNLGVIWYENQLR